MPARSRFSRGTAATAARFAVSFPVENSLTTGPEDLLVLVAVESTEALRDFVLDSLTKRREVAGVRTEVVFDHLQNHVVAPARPT